jgi:hypothetical protein
MLEESTRIHSELSTQANGEELALKVSIVPLTYPTTFWTTGTMLAIGRAGAFGLTGRRTE